MNIYEKNLEFFRDNLEFVYNCLIFEQSRYNSKINVISDPLNLCVENEGKKCFIHSTYDINRENSRMFSSINEDVEKLVIFGFGVGKCIDYINNNYKNLRNITIIEPDLNIFKIMLNYVDMVKLMNKIGNITFIVNKSKEEATEILWDCLKDSLTEKVDLIYNIAYRSLYLDDYEYINKTIANNVKNYQINISTEDLFLFKWAENILNNNKQDAYLLSKLVGKFNNVPVVLVSAGPSLNYNMQYLEQVKDKAIIIALGSAIRILDHNGIIPHFRLAFDGSEAERNVFKNIDTEASALIFSDMLNYNIVNEYKGNKLRMVLDTDYISQYIQSEVYGNNYIFQSGFSVVNVALDVVLKLGFKKVIFMGQDLCYTEGNVHAKGTWREDNEVNIDESKYSKTTNVRGETVYTDKPFLGMRDLLEQKIKMNSGNTYINATERGLYIEGTINKNFTEVIKEDLINDFDIELILNEVFSEDSKSNHNEKIEALNTTLTNNLKDLIKINDDRLKRLKKLSRYYNKGLGISKLEMELNYIQTIENDLENIDFYRVAVKPMLFSKFKAIYMNYSYNGKDPKIIVEKNIKALLGQTVSLKEYLSFIYNLIAN
ncbi:motility associated factor glycosyltransferase family protein [Desulfitobacterium metallireducens]|uniref:6-hydroxymethylpterin diphosphokinase MptE-like domain-containing protein n=1 Tax=Desulfitobacterium metallireducens DSM 15288 TaxID=871968 RepID=W0ECR9_9FIRM|nr:6-hydroxymethylpterin diphosphokinase MptE-like protein [Desulfitobacterium metallireducens]AHF08655.1 hypothetical protein DESME_12800 [Desulfitobacterium metallireducens DSM 15288]